MILTKYDVLKLKYTPQCRQRKLLNHPGAVVGSQQFDIGQMGPELIPTEVSKAMSIMSRVKPGGVTPLTDRLNEIYKDVMSMMTSLEAEGKKIAIVLATDGKPTDSSGVSNSYTKECFVESLRRLEGLPIWLVIRLCTDDEEVVVSYAFSTFLSYKVCILM